MAIYHTSIKIVSRGAGRSAVAAAAYRSCSKIVNDRDGVVHDFTRKRGLVSEFVVLPDRAPERFADRSVLWNEVERVEKAENSQLAREFEIALPHELSREEQVALAREICGYLAGAGMICDCAVHDAGDDGHNIHAHILCPMRSCDEGGFLAKAVTAYTVRLGGEEAAMTAAELKDARARGEGWEKVYTYRLGNERRQLTPTEAEGWEGCKRQGKNPVKAKHMTNDWNDKDKAEVWRAAVADMTNRALERSGSTARVDHRSLERQGADRLPTVHEGPVVRAMERRAAEIAKKNGRPYEPVTDARRANLDVARRNGVIADLARRLAEVIDAIKRRVGWWQHRPDRAEPARRRYIAAHRARAMRTAARVRAERERVERATMALDELISRSFSTEDLPGPACWGAQSMLVSGDDVRLMDRRDAGEILKGVDLKVLESVAKSRGFEYRNTEILPSAFTTDQLEFLADKRPDLFDAAAAIEYPEVLEAIDRHDAGAYMSYVEPEPPRRAGRDRGLDR